MQTKQKRPSERFKRRWLAARGVDLEQGRPAAAARPSGYEHELLRMLRECHWRRVVPAETCVSTAAPHGHPGRGLAVVDPAAGTAAIMPPQVSVKIAGVRSVLLELFVKS